MVVTGFVRQAEEIFNRDLRIDRMLSANDALIASRCAPLPDDWLEMDLVRIAVAPSAYYPRALRRSSTSRGPSSSPLRTNAQLASTPSRAGRSLSAACPIRPTGRRLRIDYYAEVPVFSDTQAVLGLHQISRSLSQRRALPRRASCCWRRTDRRQLQTDVRRDNSKAQRRASLFARFGLAAVAHSNTELWVDDRSFISWRSGGSRAADHERLCVAAHRRSWATGASEVTGGAYARQGPVAFTECRHRSDGSRQQRHSHFSAGDGGVGHGFSYFGLWSCGERREFSRFGRADSAEDGQQRRHGAFSRRLADDHGAMTCSLGKWQWGVGAYSARRLTLLGRWPLSLLFPQRLANPESIGGRHARCGDDWGYVSHPRVEFDRRSWRLRST